MAISELYDDYSLDDRNEKGKNGVLSSFTFICVVIILTLFGLIMMYSASYAEATNLGLSPTYFIVRQAIFAVIGFIAITIIAFIPIKWIKAMIVPILVIALITMLLTLFSPWGVTVLGATRWLELPGLPQFQPSELVKIAIILFLAAWFSSEKSKKYLGWYYVVPILVIGLFAALILLQRAFSTTILFTLLSLALLVCGGIKFRYILGAGFFLIVPAIYLLLSESYRVKRIASFIFPDLDPSGLNYQVRNSIAAIAEGGFLGKGLGNGVYKLGRIPEVQNDFIFASIAEEMGFVGVLAILLLFAYFGYMGFKTAKKMESKDTFLSITAFGITTMIILQMAINIFVVIGLLPPTGIPLPFFSQGGTNLMIILVECGLLFRIVRIAGKS